MTKFYSRSDFFSLKGRDLSQPLWQEMASWKQETHGFFGVRNFESEKTHGDWEVDKKLSDISWFLRTRSLKASSTGLTITIILLGGWAPIQ